MQQNLKLDGRTMKTKSKDMIKFKILIPLALVMLILLMISVAGILLLERFGMRQISQHNHGHVEQMFHDDVDNRCCKLSLMRINNYAA